ncbi:PepSY domain-containing protein [Mycobacterium sp. ITM-2016-00317]|uniref:PepSY domain-containing protein n=1 Tax=Mycobacterium sp. ITM-2016-00317 TaxID=2099694 RepID=UPI00287F9CC5|nr:PepSY domain-containing protein [Mycobacterium sp. ITM-2016-00317]WNG85697.1 PepSY domain-containing protein [Mycobacterium sp. ITM-2016-00317]
MRAERERAGRVDGHRDDSDRDDGDGHDLRADHDPCEPGTYRGLRTAAGPAGPGLPVPAAQEALRASAAAVPNGRPYDVQVETRDGQRVFEVTVASNGQSVDVVVDAAGTRVISSAPDDGADDDARRAEAAAVDAARALQTAAEREPDTLLDELEIDSDGAQVVWKIDLVHADGSTIEVRVDAQDGSIR